MTAQPVVQSVAAQAPYPTIYSGVNQQLTAIAQFSDGTQVNVTNTAEWSSSEPQVGGASQWGTLAENYRLVLP